MLASAKMQAYDHSLRIPMLFAGPGIRRNSQLDWLGTQVDVAPTILGLAGIPTPADVDGRSIVPLLVSAAVAAEQAEDLPGSVRQSLFRHAHDAPMERAASFHTYYNQGPEGVGDDGAGGAPRGAPRVDDWSNTWRALHYKRSGNGRDLKYIEFDPFGKQTAFASPAIYALFDLGKDPYELQNIYNATTSKATVAGAELLAELRALAQRYQTCTGVNCP